MLGMYHMNKTAYVLKVSTLMFSSQNDYIFVTQIWQGLL